MIKTIKQSVMLLLVIAFVAGQTSGMNNNTINILKQEFEKKGGIFATTLLVCALSKRLGIINSNQKEILSKKLQHIHNTLTTESVCIAVLAHIFPLIYGYKHYALLQFNPTLYELDKCLLLKAEKQLEQLDKNDAIYLEYNKIMSETKDINKDIYLDILEKFRNKNPMFLISECTDKGCGFTREKIVGPRHLVERTAINTLQTIVDKQDNKLVVVCFASGNLYSELNILDEIFEKFPDLTVDLHCIDTKYHIVDKQYQSATSNIIELNKRQQEAIELDVKKIIFSNNELEYLKNNNSSEEQARTHLLLQKLEQEELFHQFINYIDKKHPKVNLKLYVYAKGADYIASLDNNSTNVADMVLAMDLTLGDHSIPAIKDCFKVCNAVTKYNKNAQNIISNSGFGDMRIMHTHQPQNNKGYTYLPASHKNNYLGQDHYCKGYGRGHWPVHDRDHTPLAPFLNDLYYQGFYVKTEEKKIEE